MIKKKIIHAIFSAAQNYTKLNQILSYYAIFNEVGRFFFFLM